MACHMGKHVGAGHISTGENSRHSGAQKRIHFHRTFRANSNTQIFQSQPLNIGTATNREQYAVKAQFSLSSRGTENTGLLVLGGAKK